MSFLAGAVSYLRFRPSGAAPGRFGPGHLEALEAAAIGRQRVAAADGVEVGWAAGGHVLDGSFDPEKNVVADALAFEFAVVTDRPPADLLRAYAAIELKALSASNPSGLPSAKQKREAKEYARERLEQEAKDGRFKKRKCVPVLWDGPTGEVLFGATALTHIDRFAALFKESFGVELTAITAGSFPAPPGLPTLPDPAAFRSPAGFVGLPFDGVAWIADEACRDWLGNEFLLWLWFLSEGESDTVKLGDGSEVTFMFARDLVLECPRGQTGADGFRHEGPTRLPEARRAIQAGKLPRRAGLVLVRHDEQYAVTLHAETLGVSGGKLPAPDEENPRARLEERVGRVRHLRETLDLLYSRFLLTRLGDGWPVEAERMRAWLGADRDRDRKAVA